MKDNLTLRKDLASVEVAIARATKEMKAENSMLRKEAKAEKERAAAEASKRASVEAMHGRLKVEANQLREEMERRKKDEAPRARNALFAEKPQHGAEVLEKAKAEALEKLQEDLAAEKKARSQLEEDL